MKIPKNVRISKNAYGHIFFRLRIIRDTEPAFGKLVARQAYNLTHELVRNKLGTSSQDGRYTGATDAAWMELDRVVGEFADTY
jgi:hypothetical protein